jgi:hypothetical protein
MAPTAAIVAALGSLFSLGVVFVREVLGASDAQFGWLIALFGVGAVVGLAALQQVRADDELTNIERGVIVQGATIVVMSLANGLALAFAAAVVFGAATAFVLACGMSVLQSTLEGHERVLGFTAFHVVVRGGLSVAAIAAGIAGDLIGEVKVPMLGVLAPSRLVLLCAGLLVLSSASMLHSMVGRTTLAGLDTH